MEAIYWRKVYYVHDWVSSRTPGGLGNCDYTDLSRDDIADLRNYAVTHGDNSTVNSLDRLLERYGKDWRFLYTADW